MRTRKWQRQGNSGIAFTELGLGTGPLGNLYTAIDEDEAQSILDVAWRSGIRYFDTAPMYGLGLAETRINRFLRNKNRDDYVLGGKVGRLLRRTPAAQRDGIGFWMEVPNRKVIYDYTYDGVMRSVEDSFERMGVDRFDILMVHDLDVFTHGSKEAFEQMAKIFFKEGGYRAMVKLRDEGVTTAIGSGQNDVECSQAIAERGDFDVFLVPGRYTLLEQSALDNFLPFCEERGIGVVIGGPYNSGILATGPVEGAYYNYSKAPPEILNRVRNIQTHCERHGVRLIEAAFHFPLMHRQIVSVIPGGGNVEQMKQNVQVANATVPEALWHDLKSAGLLHEKAPIN
ncbi:aldo/keto reductase [Paraburkholderia phymatum]|uniref:aldo/keto reductase n=1 Tax=Paraburkholderia phymatum TaxID=148447 RepID=UPI00317E597C